MTVSWGIGIGPTVLFSVETARYLLNVVIDKAGREEYRSNGKKVDALPIIASGSVLLAVVRRHKMAAVALLQLPYGGPEWQTAWWALDTAIRDDDKRATL